MVIDSEIRTLRSFTEMQLEQQVHPNILINGGASYTVDQGEVDSYSGPVNQQQLGLFARWRQEFPTLNWRMNVNLRQDFIEYYRVPFTPALGLEGKLFWIVSAKISISRNFRVPTFNDRYWVPGGNEDLEPERSWNEEASLIFDMNMEAFRNKTWMVFTAFNSNVDNWILWVPEGTVWSAQNVQKVWARGLEAEYRSEFNLGRVGIGFIGGYTYARSTNEAQQGEGDNTYGKQLIYVPIHRYFFTGNILFSGFTLSYNQARTGERYVTRDNTESLPGYTVANAVLSKNLHVGGQDLAFSFEVANLFDTDYQAVQYNPMPGRNYKISIILNFTRKDHENTELETPGD
jgi:iron complex outermembrane receptor protein